MTALRAVQSDPPVTRLDELANIIKHEHALVVTHGRELINAAIRTGEALLEARGKVERGMWLTWVDENVPMELSAVYRYMRIAEHKELVLASRHDTISAVIKMLADQPRRGHGPTSLEDEVKAMMWDMAQQGVPGSEIAEQLGVSKSTVSRWTSLTSPDSWQSKQIAEHIRERGSRATPKPRRREITNEMIEALACWLCERFGGDHVRQGEDGWKRYPRRVTDAVRGDAENALLALFGER